MTITQHTRRRVLDAIPPKGAPLREIAASSGVHISNVRTVAGHLIEERKVFSTRAGTGQEGKHEVWIFWNEAARDSLVAEWQEKVAQKERQRNAERAERRRAERAVNPRRSIAAERREAERARVKAEAEAEHAKLKAAQAKLREVTKRDSRMPELPKAKAPTVTVKKTSAWDAAAPAILPPGVKVTRVPAPPSRFHVEIKEGGFSSLPPGVYALPAATCAARAFSEAA